MRNLNAYTDAKLARNIKNIFENYLIKNKQIINSSQEKHIVCTLGFTGSGKSTLLNYLCEKNLIVQNEGGMRQIALENPNDPTSFQIGQGNDSSTLLPQFTEHNGVCFYDFAGFEDTRGVEYSILNACFIKNIVEQAKSVLFLFVFDQSTLKSKRGQDFLEFFEKVKSLLPGIQSKPNLNGLIITKAEQQNEIDFKYFIQSPNQPLISLESKINLNLQIFKMSKPQDNHTLCKQDLDKIMHFCQTNQGNHYSQINVEAIYSLKESNIIDCIFSDAMVSIINGLFCYKDYSILTTEQLLQEKQQFINFCQSFEKLTQENELIFLLRSVAEENYQKNLKNFEKMIQEQVNFFVDKIENLINNIKKDESIKHLFEQQKFMMQKVSELAQSISKMNRRNICNIF